MTALVSTACTSPTRIDQVTATRIATEFLVSGQGSGATVSNVKIDSIEPVVDGGRPAWKVSISGEVTEAGRTSPSYTSHQMMYIYSDNGEVRVFAQG